MNRQVKLLTGLSLGAALGAASSWPVTNGTRISLSQVSYLFELGLDHPEFQAQIMPWVIKTIIGALLLGMAALAFDKLLKLKDH